VGNPSTGVNRVRKPGASFVKEDVDLAVDKAVESGLINFDKRVVSNDSGYCQP
jgi:hypothetical protein